MKIVKSISLFLFYPLLMFSIGFVTGIIVYEYFYPGRDPILQIIPSERQEREASPVSYQEETLCVDTKYEIWERDMDGETTVETTWKVPDKYIGMNREQFLDAMEQYEAFPPLSEMERGFVSLEVLSFSRERVVIQMNYQYIEPSSGFYLGVYNNEIMVYLEDKSTVYIETKMKLEILPEYLQNEIIQMMWIADEEALYDFLETYTS